MENHLRYAGKDRDTQAAALEAIVRAEPVLMAVLGAARALALPDWWLVSGAIYNTVWNSLTGLRPMTGVKDIDLFYFDDTDLSYEAEDAVIKLAAPIFAQLPVPVEIRNQARVHLWSARPIRRCAPAAKPSTALPPPPTASGYNWMTGTPCGSMRRMVSTKCSRSG
jgi:hypothetical protein